MNHQETERADATKTTSSSSDQQQAPPIIIQNNPPTTPSNPTHATTLPPPPSSSSSSNTEQQPPDTNNVSNENENDEEDDPTQTKTTTTTTTTSTKKTNGIDVNEAVSILSSRARAKAKARTKQQQLRSVGTAAIDGSDDGGKPAGTTAEQRKMGQTIDLLRSQEWARTGSDGCGSDEPPPSPAPATATAPTETERQKLLRSRTPPQLLRTLFQLQRERVLTYRQFDAGLDTVLRTGNLTQYPHLTMRVTAAFAVVSGSINEVADVFRCRRRQDEAGDGDEGGAGGVEQWIEKLQGLEKEKLNYTAALHLEKIRGRNEVVEQEIAFQNASSSGSGGDGNERIAKLLEESIVSLQGKVSGCVEGINDILEELRYSAAEMDE